jgi:hypothetical protein
MLSRRWLQVAAFVVLALSTTLLGGCIQIQVIDQTPPSPDPAAGHAGGQADEHDVAVLAVDFDPPLEYDEVMAQKDRGEGLTLLVAVENQGCTVESEVTVEVELCKDGAATPFLYKQGVIDAIAPGEIKIVHFGDTEVPFSYEYQLQVRVVPLRDERRLDNNQKSYDLLITQP